MANYATAAVDVQARLPQRTLSAGSTPTAAQVDEWITEACAEVDGEMLVQGLIVPITDARGVNILKSKVTSYATARWLDSVTAATDLEGKAQAQALMKEFTDFVTLVRDDIARAATMLGQAPGASGAIATRSYWTDRGATVDGQSIPTGQSGNPVFTKNPAGPGNGPLTGGAGGSGRW